MHFVIRVLSERHVVLFLELVTCRMAPSSGLCWFETLKVMAVALSVACAGYRLPVRDETAGDKMTDEAVTWAWKGIPTELCQSEVKKKQKNKPTQKKLKKKTWTWRPELFMTACDLCINYFGLMLKFWGGGFDNILMWPIKGKIKIYGTFFSLEKLCVIFDLWANHPHPPTPDYLPFDDGTRFYF